MRGQGTVVKWNDDKDFGFIAPSDGKPDLFVHHDFFVHQSRCPRVGDIVSFEIATNAEGKRRAERVLFDGEPDPRRLDRLVDTLYSAFSLIFLAAMATLVYAEKVAPFFLLLYVGCSILTFLLYQLDKTKARKEQRRIAEKILHLCSVIGGWPGALLAQRLLHHKSRKRSFQIVFIITVILNLALVSSLTLLGADVLHSDRVVRLYRQLRQPFVSSPSPASNNRPKSAVYSWINKDGKRVYSNVGFPTNEPYRDGRIEWH